MTGRNCIKKPILFHQISCVSLLQERSHFKKKGANLMTIFSQNGTSTNDYLKATFPSEQWRLYGYKGNDKLKRILNAF
jgi:hypothetical protein